MLPPFSNCLIVFPLPCLLSTPSLPEPSGTLAHEQQTLRPMNNQIHRLLSGHLYCFPNYPRQYLRYCFIPRRLIGRNLFPKSVPLPTSFAAGGLQLC